MAVSQEPLFLKTKGITLISSPQAIATCASKKALDAAFQSAGMKTAELLNPDEIKHFPVFARPDCGSGSRGAGIVRDAVDLNRLNLKDMAITRFIQGKEYSIDGFVDANGTLIHAICRSRDEVRFGLAVRSRVVPLGDLRKSVAVLAKNIGLFGFFNLQFREDELGRTYFFDLNPRLGGAMTLSFEAGLNPVSLLEATIKQQPIHGQFQTREGLCLYRRYENVFIESSE